MPPLALLECVEDRRLLSAGPTVAAALTEPAPDRAALVAPATKATFKPSALLGTYSGTVKLTKPTGVKPIKFTLTITSISTSLAVEGKATLGSLGFKDIALAKSSFDKKTGILLLRFVSKGTPPPQTLSITLKGAVTPQDVAKKQITGRFSGYVPFNNQPRVQVDGTYTVKKA
jgi:hypothetical protein